MGYLSSRLMILMAVQLGCCASAFLTSSKPAPFQRTALSAESVAAPSAQFHLEFVKTPGSKDTPHNFGRASPLDSVMHSAERPGNPSEKDGKVSTEEVQKWINYVRDEQGVTNVIALLDEDEMIIYEEPGLQKMMESNGLKFHIRPMGEEEAPEKIMSLIDEAEERGEKILCHCTGGIGRCGRVCAAWLVHRYDLSPEVCVSYLCCLALNMFDELSTQNLLSLK